MNVISEKEYSFSNVLFWNVMLHHHIRAFDEERDANFDEVWDEEPVSYTHLVDSKNNIYGVMDDYVEGFGNDYFKMLNQLYNR